MNDANVYTADFKMTCHKCIQSNFNKHSIKNILKRVALISVSMNRQFYCSEDKTTH